MTPRWWTMLRGAARWLSRPRAEVDVQRRRAEACATCPSLRVYCEVHLAVRVAPRTGWCGRPGEAVEGEACGCLVLAEADDGTVEVAGRRMGPAGKATCEGETCPRGRWNET